MAQFFGEIIDNSVLVLGASSIDPKVYQALAYGVNSQVLGCSGGTFDVPARTPINTKKFVKSVDGDPNKEKKIYERALKCIDNAQFIIVDISEASTGMGLEVGYMLTMYAGKKFISFIAKEGSKVSPHIAGMWEHLTGKKIEVGFYKNEKDVCKTVMNTDACKKFEIDLTH